jgi:hypothetical protein
MALAPLVSRRGPAADVNRQDRGCILIDGASRELSFPPKYGADTRRVLAQAGYADAEVDRLDRVVARAPDSCVAPALAACEANSRFPVIVSFVFRQ